MRSGYTDAGSPGGKVRSLSSLALASLLLEQVRWEESQLHCLALRCCFYFPTHHKPYTKDGILYLQLGMPDVDKCRMTRSR